MQVKVHAKNVKISAKKVRLIIELIRNSTINKARAQLKFYNKEAAKPVSHLLTSAIASAKDKNIDIDNLSISNIYCNEGPALKRRRIKERGKATAIRKRSSHITLELSEINKLNKEQ